MKANPNYGIKVPGVGVWNVLEHAGMLYSMPVG
jgi:hypothetical protein